MVFTITLAASVTVTSAGQRLSALVAYLALIGLLSYLRRAQYFSAGTSSVGGRNPNCWSTPLYGALHLLVLLSLKLVAAITLLKRSRSTRISSKHQITLPVAVLRAAQLGVSDRLRAAEVGPGRVVLERLESVIDEFADALTGRVCRRVDRKN